MGCDPRGIALNCPTPIVVAQERVSSGEMHKSLLNPQTCQELLARLECLRSDAAPLWGRMSAPQMVAHLVDWMRMADGEIETVVWNSPLRYSPVKQLIIYWLPFPKGVSTAPELIGREPSSWPAEHVAMRRHLESFATRDRRASWPLHPAFGKLSSNAWGVLGYRHTDHHFRQFGI
jgi:hypothetical protein